MERERLLGSDLFVFSDKPVGRERESDWIACNLGYYTGVSKLRTPDQISLRWSFPTISNAM